MSAPGRLRSVALLGGGTALAALFGLGFQALLAFHFGAGEETDAWFMSLSIFGFLAKFLMLTHLKSIALPVHRRLQAASPAAARELGRGLLAWAGGGVALLAALLVVAAPLLVDALAPGYEGRMRELTVTLLRIRTPALAFLATSAAGLVVLESAHRFGVSVSAQKVVPAALTLVLLAAVGDRFGMVGVGWIGFYGALGGGLVVLAWAGPMLRRPSSGAGGRAPSAAEAAVGSELKGIGATWLRFGGSNAATFVGEWAFRVAASLLPVGLFSAVLYGRMAHDLMHGALNDPAHTVSLPRFSAAAAEEPAEGDDATARVGRELRESLHALAAVTLPVGLVVVVLSPWIVALLFGRGRFAADGMTGPSATALRIFAVGFVVQGLNQLVFAAAFASRRADLVNRVQIAGHLVRAALLVPAVLLFSYVGLVGAQVAMNVLVLLLLAAFAPPGWGLRPGGAGTAGWREALRVVGAAAAVGTAAAAVVARLPDPLVASTALRAAVVLLVGAGAGAGYALLAAALGVAPVRALWARVRAGRAATLLALAAGVAVADPGAATAQGVGRAFVLDRHWAPAVLELLEARGTVPTGTARRGPLSGAVTASLLSRGGDAGERAAGALRSEMGGRASHAGLNAWVGAGVAGSPGPAPGASGGRSELSVRMGGAEARLFAAGRVAFGAGGPEQSVREAMLGVRAGPVDVHLGRMRLQAGGGAGGALVLSPSATLDGLLATTPSGFGLGGIGRAFVTAGLFSLGRYEAVADPWFGVLRFVAAPAEWVSLGVSRAALVGGRFGGGTIPFDPALSREPDPGSVSLADVVSILLGRVTEVDNQVFSFDARVGLSRLGLPGVAWAEVALEDNERSFGDGAIQLGLLVATPPGRTAATFRYEYTGVGGPGRWCAWCDTLPAFWYQHTRFQSGWQVRDELLGHPLAGYGLEHRLELAAFDPAFRLRARVAGARLRRDAWNLLEEERPGWAWGLRARLSYRAARAAEVAAAADLEWGDAGWRQGRVGVLLAIRLAGGTDPPG